MFCPKCAAQNIDGASFCRVCGANIGLVQQAMAGRLPESESPAIYVGSRRRRKNRDRQPPSLERGIVNVFAGLGFIIAALAIMWKFPGGIFWGWSFFFPGFSTLGRGIANIVAAQKLQRASLPPAQNNPEQFVPNRLPNATQPFLSAAAGRNTGEMVPQPPSVTEGTTRHLGAEAPTKYLDESSEYQK